MIDVAELVFCVAWVDGVYVWSCFLIWGLGGGEKGAAPGKRGPPRGKGGRPGEKGAVLCPSSLLVNHDTQSRCWRPSALHIGLREHHDRKRIWLTVSTDLCMVSGLARLLSQCHDTFTKETEITETL